MPDKTTVLRAAIEAEGGGQIVEVETEDDMPPGKKFAKEGDRILAVLKCDIKRVYHVMWL